jgi:hypothetical protein
VFTVILKGCKMRTYREKYIEALDKMYAIYKAYDVSKISFKVKALTLILAAAAAVLFTTIERGLRQL